MSVTFIASNGSLKLFSRGNYEYDICRLQSGEIKMVKKLYNYTYENAVKFLLAM